MDLVKILHRVGGLSRDCGDHPRVTPGERKMCLSVAAIILCSFTRWQCNCVNTVEEILCQSCTDYCVLFFVYRIYLVYMVVKRLIGEHMSIL